MKKGNSKWVFILILLVVLFFVGIIFAGIVAISTDVDIGGNVALIPVKGVIMADGDYTIFSEQVAASTEIIENIEKAGKDPNIKGIIFEINSPGGGAVASEEIMNAIKKVNKTKVAWIREVGASGGYWIASSADYIFASRMSLTGSIGVRGSYLQFSGFLEDHNVTYQRLVAGKYKDIGSPVKDLTRDEKKVLQDLLDRMHVYFVESVRENRNLSEEAVKEVSEAKLFLGEDAMKLGLIDEIGGKDEVIDYLANKLNITVDLREYKRKKGFFDIFSMAMNEKSFFVGKGIGDAMINGVKVGNSLEIIT